MQTWVQYTYLTNKTLIKEKLNDNPGLPPIREPGIGRDEFF
jgi:hypothetical protein